MYIDVVVTANRPIVAANIANALCELFITSKSKDSYVGTCVLTSKATPASQPIKPARIKIFAISVFVAGFISVLLCILLEMLDYSIKTKEEVVRVTRLPLLGLLTTLQATPKMFQSIVARMVAIDSGKAFAITPIGAVSNQATTTLGLAHACVELGYKTLLIDANTESSSLSENAPKFDTNLPSHTYLEMRDSPVFPNMSFLSIGTRLRNGFNRDTINALLKQCEKDFDLILFNVADISTTPSAQIIGLNDSIQTVLLVNTYVSKKEALLGAVRSDVFYGLNPIGSIVTENKRKPSFI